MRQNIHHFRCPCNAFTGLPLIRKGEQKALVEMLKRQITKRFGSLPNSVSERLSKASESELDEVSLRILDAKNTDELFPH